MLCDNQGGSGHMVEKFGQGKGGDGRRQCLCRLCGRPPTGRGKEEQGNERIIREMAKRGRIHLFSGALFFPTHIQPPRSATEPRRESLKRKKKGTGRDQRKGIRTRTKDMSSGVNVGSESRGR